MDGRPSVASDCLRTRELAQKLRRVEQEAREERELAADRRNGLGRNERDSQRLRHGCHVDAGRTAEAVVDVWRLILLRVVRRGVRGCLRAGRNLRALGVNRAERHIPDVHAEIHPSQEQQRKRGDAIERAEARELHVSLTIARGWNARNNRMHLTHS